MMASNPRRSKWILFTVLVAVMTASGLIQPLLPFLVESMGGSGRDIGLMAAVFSVMQLIFSPLWGNLSDAIGRKPVMIIGLLGSTIVLLLFAFCTRLWMFYGVRIISGLLASATIPTAMAYIGDTTSSEERSDGMGLVNGALYTGLMLGPALSGWLANVSMTLPFYIGSGLSALLVVFVLLLLPESLAPEQRKTARIAIRFRTPDSGRPGSVLHGTMGYYLFLSLLLALGLACFWSVIGLFALRRDGLGPGAMGTIMATIGVTTAIVQMGFTGPLARRWGHGVLIRTALIGSAVGFLAMLVAKGFVGLLVTSCICMLANSLIRPLIATQISQAATEGQGKAMGLNNTFMSLGQILGSAGGGFALDLNPSLPFLGGATVMLLGWATTFFTTASGIRVDQKVKTLSGFQFC